MNIIGFSGLHNSVAFKQKYFPNLTARDYRIVFGHDSAAALVTSEGIQAAGAEERFSRQKGTGDFPVNAINYCMQAANLQPDDVDFLAHGWSFEPYKSFFQDRGEFATQQFESVFSKEAQIGWIERYLPEGNWSDKLVQVPHHYAHAASAYYASGFDEALILVADGMGEAHSTSVAVGKGNDINIIQQVPALHSLGILYGVFTLYLGFYFNFDEYKVMGLAPYGNSRRYFNKIMELIHLKDDGTFTNPILFENHSQEEKETYSGTLRILAETFGPTREPESEITQQHMDIAASLQAAVQASLLQILRHFKQKTGQRNLCMAGGVALNCTANSVIKRSRLFSQTFIQPASGDDGTAIGAALYVQRQNEPNLLPHKMGQPLWGPRFTDEQIREVLDERDDCEYTYFNSFEEYAKQIALLITEGKIIGWFQGNMEFGPRALGGRSILGDPRNPGMRDKINALVKKREWFRPFAPAVAAEAASKFFEIDEGDEAPYAYMLLVTQTRKKYQEELPAITHVNGSARVQTVAEDENYRFWTLINEVGNLTGIPMVLNTSFNVRGQPIVCTPTEGIDTFIMAELDILAIGNFLVVRKEAVQEQTEQQASADVEAVPA